MAIYEDKLNYETMQKYARTRSCECGASLVVAWSAPKNCYVLKCGRGNLEHDAMILIDTSAEDNEVKRRLQRRNKRLEKQVGHDKALTLRQYEGLQVLNREQAREILVTIWPKAPETEITKAILVCTQYQLNPLMKHVFLIPFNEGKPAETWAMVLGIKASRIIASRAKPYGYIDGTPRVMTENEQKQILGAVDPNKLWAITKLRDKDGFEYSGYGWYPKNATPYGTDKGNSALNMAFIRSERQGLDKLCPGRIPEGDVVDERFIDITPFTTVDTKTGEIVGEKPPETPATEGAVSMAQPETAQTTKEPAKQETPPENEKKRQKYKTDPDSLKNYGDLMTAVAKDFPALRTRTDILKELGVKAVTDLTETPAELYRKVASVRS